MEFDSVKRSFQAGVPTAGAWQQLSGPEALISGVNAALVSLRMGLYTMPDMVKYVWSFLTPRVRDHMDMILAALQFQLVSAIPPCYQGKPSVPTMEEVRGGVTKGPEAEGFLLSAKGPLVAVDAEPLVVFPGKGPAASFKSVKVSVVEGDKAESDATRVEAKEETEGGPSSGGATSGAAGTSGGSGGAGGGDDDNWSGDDDNPPVSRPRTALQGAARAAGDQLTSEDIEDCLRELEGIELGNIELKNDCELDGLFTAQCQPPPIAVYCGCGSCSSL